MGNLRVSNEVIYAKTETTYGTDSTPTTTDAILVRSVSMQPEGLRQNTRDAVRASIGQLQTVYGGQLMRITFECEVKGSGTAGTAPEIGPLLEACGLEETIVAVTSVTYAPESAAHESVTIYYFEGGRKRHILTGCVGKVTIKADAGGIMLAAFEFVGHYTEPTDVSIPSPSYDSAVPRAAVGMALTINGVSAIVAKSFEWQIDNVIATPESIQATDGYGQVQITSRNIHGSTVIESELDAVIDVDNLKSQGTRFAWVSGQLGSTAGNRVNITTPASSTYIMDSSLGDSSGIRLRTLELAVDDSTPNTEISIAFT